MRKYCFMKGSFPGLCEEINYIPLPGEVWNSCLVCLIRCGLLWFCFQG